MYRARNKLSTFRIKFRSQAFCLSRSEKDKSLKSRLPNFQFAVNVLPPVTLLKRNLSLTCRMEKINTARNEFKCFIANSVRQSYLITLKQFIPFVSQINMYLQPQVMHNLQYGYQFWLIFKQSSGLPITRTINKNFNTFLKQ